MKLYEKRSLLLFYYAVHHYHELSETLKMTCERLILIYLVETSTRLTKFYIKK